MCLVQPMETALYARYQESAKAVVAAELKIEEAETDLGELLPDDHELILAWHTVVGEQFGLELELQERFPSPEATC